MEPRWVVFAVLCAGMALLVAGYFKATPKRKWGDRLEDTGAESQDTADSNTDPFIHH